jgi:hypothetical protein
MLIWRNLDPQLLGRLLAHAAETRAAAGRARRGQPTDRDLCRADATADQASRPGGRHRNSD